MITGEPFRPFCPSGAYGRERQSSAFFSGAVSSIARGVYAYCHRLFPLFFVGPGLDVILFDILLPDTLEFGFGQDAEQLPAKV
jgi:hypothetical protein